MSFNSRTTSARQPDAERPFPFHRTHMHRLRKSDDSEVPAFFWPVVLLLGSAAVALICWGAYNYLDPRGGSGGKYLRFAGSSPTFNATSAEASSDGPELLPEPEVDVAALEGGLALATVEPPLLPVPAVELPAPKPVAAESVTVEPPRPEPKIELPLLPAPPPLPALEPPPVTQVQASAPKPALVEVPPVPPTAPGLLPGVPAKAVTFEVQNLTPLVFRDAPLGDSPMLRNWKTLALYSLMTTAVYVQVPSPAAAQDKEKEKNLVDSIDQLKKTIDDSFKGVRADFMALKDEVKKIQDDGLKQRLSLSAAAGKIEDIEKALDDLKIKVQSGSASKAAGIDKSSVEEIKLKLGAIEQAILKLQPATSRIAMAPPASVGRVVLLNLYPEKLLFVVNDKSYVVPANSTVSLDNLPAGTLTYELIADYWGSRGRNSSKLAANETLTLTAK